VGCCFVPEAAEVVGDGCAESEADMLSGNVINLEPSLFLYFAPLAVGDSGGGSEGAGWFRDPLDFILTGSISYKGAGFEVIEGYLATARPRRVVKVYRARGPLVT
jgi:hypothetical protein